MLQEIKKNAKTKKNKNKNGRCTSIEPKKKRKRFLRLVISFSKVIIKSTTSRFIDNNITCILRKLNLRLSRESLDFIFLFETLLGMKLGGCLHMMNSFEETLIDPGILLQLGVVEMAKLLGLLLAMTLTYQKYH